MATEKREKIYTDEEIRRLREATKRDITPKNMQPERPAPTTPNDTDRFEKRAVWRAAGIYVQNF